MSTPKRFKLVLKHSTDLFVPSHYEFPDEGVVPFQGLGLLIDTYRKANSLGIETVTYKIEATEITLLGPDDADRWVRCSEPGRHAASLLAG